MSGFARRLISAAALVLFVAAAALTIGYFYFRSSIQPLEGTIEVSGLEMPVTVIVDRYSIPHLYAARESDLFFAQGFVHASERLWQMEMFRRVAQGRLAELFGERALGADRVVRTLDLWGAARRSLDALGAEERRLLEAYAAGVNARLSTWNGPLPPEFVILGFRPEPWEPQATAAIGKVMALDLSAWRTELARFYATGILPPEKSAYLPPVYPEWGVTILDEPVPLPSPTDARSADVGSRPSRSSASEATTKPRVAAARSLESWRRAYGLLARYGFHASNAWAVGRDRTMHGGSLLASDMHLGLDAPAKWYLVALHAEETGFDVAGVSLPGVPGVVVGYNEGVAWGFTNGMTNDMDFAIEALNLDRTAYRDGGTWRPFGVRSEMIPVRGIEEPVIHEVRSTVRGPVITDVLPPLGATLSVLWVASRPTTELDGLLRMNRATGAAQFDLAVQEFDSPQQNVVYAASDGTIGYRLSGTVPLHSGQDGSLPVEFDRIAGGWSSFWPAAELPATRDPPSGFIVTANNLQAPNLFGVLGSDYAAPFRAARIRERLETGRSWTAQEMAALQHDTYSRLADLVVPRAIAASRRVGDDSVTALLEDWDRRVDEDSRAASIFYAWFYRLRDLVAGDEFVNQPWKEFPALALVRILEEGGSPWVDDVRTDTLETLARLEEQALIDAVRVTGGRPWGEIHFERSVHVLSGNRLLERWFRFNVGPYPTGGAPNTVRPDDYGRWSPLDSTSWTPPYLGDYGPSERFVADMGETGAVGYFLLPTGQSGNPFSPHYRDMAARWDEPRLVPVPLRRSEVDARGSRRFQLRPRTR